MVAVTFPGEERHRQAQARLDMLRPHLEEGVPLTRAAAEAGIPLRTAQRWLARYREDGPAGLGRGVRRDTGERRFPADLVALIEGMGLKRPRVGAATIHRRIAAIARAQSWRVPSYGTVRAILARLDPALVTLAQDGPAAFRDRYELIHRHRAAAPNALWQADHTLLDILIRDQDGKPVRPWLTTVIDDHSRAIAGYLVFVGAPCVLNTCLALRHAIWRKADPAWPVCGIPDLLYVDHGSDFTSRHLDQVAAALRIRMVYSAVGRPQGRGKVERLFRTLNTELLPELPGHLVGSAPASAPMLSLAQLDAAVGAFIAGTYHARPHRETGQTPLDGWRGGGFLPRLPESLEDLDLLLVMLAAPRRVRRDGIRFQGLRYVAPTLAAYVGESITLRYDPRDLSEIRVFHRDAFLCRAVSEEHAGETVTLKDIAAARRAHRQALRATITERVARVADFLPRSALSVAPPARRARLRLYRDDVP
ncbi:Mu transposase C-terminal domain-containing protein [Methylobacterium sp.]|jgi:putative transposase|uniref:Mu transposase C-terminal domain-containing protein n=1 Tax=Methylobacterium sp. TaxID=409 RepID=UPI0025D581F9|nr:Mu transposase C-terminal domain-containing protein [Methylobacterium sp.]MBY0257421.1 Mu transposase C-terminal domain-containing protein [Methylobacterium sp.]